MGRFLVAFREIYRSISSLPVIVAVAIIGLACWQATTARVAVDLPGWLNAVNVKDLDTIRGLLAAVIGGVFTLTVFAYTMVMNVLDRSIASYSPRLVPLILSQRYHQVLLGVSIGTIAHAVILFVVTADDTNTPSPPVLAVFTSGFLAVACLFVFIYYIHRVSTTIHVNTLLRLSFENTRSRILNTRSVQGIQLGWEDTENFPAYTVGIRATEVGYLNELEYGNLPDLAARVGAEIAINRAPGSFVHPGELILGCPAEYLARLQGQQKKFHYKISAEVPIDVYQTGFKHLVEVTVKAMSPAINDPGTALTAIHYLTELFRILGAAGDFNQLTNGRGKVWVKQWSIAELRDECFREITRYTKDDPWTSDAVTHALRKVNDYVRAGSRVQG